MTWRERIRCRSCRRGLAAAPLEIEDLTAWSAARQQGAIEGWMESEKGRPFDFGRAPLFRMQVHRLGGGRFNLALSFHHSILDGWSVAAMLAELFGVYGSMREGQGFLFESRPVSLTYRDF